MPLDLSGVEALAAEHGPLRLRIAGLPPVVRLSAGDRQPDGSWLVGPAGWRDLTLFAPPDVPDFDLELLPEPDEAPAAPADASPAETPDPVARDPAPQDGELRTGDLRAGPPPDDAARATAMVPTRETGAALTDPVPAPLAVWSTLGTGTGAGGYGLPAARRESWIDAVDDDTTD